ncbi:autotransporter assembly complex protein TamA [Paracoccus spongiarum]|uniref:Autotransporter assembly complex family protein n=1 Tax=Paracoccus spongiarum TaxID=3064387 RepID=A0ABT9JAX3_9RHOB|nr:autotransporter assembly complex family protein [Paracoccus sp. 2205BS29-5]MDP5306984.1 autotransporter assembly complex family protein [Paracoccus sp. 2205BS29-5]
MSTALGFSGVALGQSSSPFSGLFGGGSEAEGPVSLSFRVAGDDGAIERNIRNSSLIAGALAEGRTTGQDVLAAARADYARILGSLYDAGHYSALIYITLDGVEAAEIAPLDAPATVTEVVVSVDPGPPFRFSRAAIAPVAPESEIPSEYARGEVAGTGTIKAAAVAGVEGWRNRGHAKADVGGQQITADHQSDSVDSQIALAPGPAVTFGRLNITGNDRMTMRRLRKIAGFPEGRPFDPEDLELVRQRLRRTGVFSAITLAEAETLGPGDTLDVDLTLVEQKPRRIGAGFELSNTDGAQVSAYWMHRNLLGGGERLRIDAEMSDIGSDTSGRDEELTLRIDRPATITPDTTAYVETKLARMREEDYDSDSASVALGFTQIFSEQLTADLAIQYHVSRVNDANGRSDFEVLALPMDVTWDKRDVPTDAKRGFYLSAEATPFKGFEDTGSGVRLLGEGRGYYSFGEDDRLTLAGRLRAGTIEGAGIAETPREYLFYSGGGGTVRGQAYQSLGVSEIPGPDGPIKTGGMSVANATAEMRFQVRENIGLVLFADYGRVWGDSSFSGDAGWHAGAGAGVRYRTPIGPLRFDIAAPVGDGDTDDGVQLYLGLGQAF